MPAMANPHRDPTPMNTVVEDSDQNFVDGLIKKTPAELQAIGLNKLRSRCLSPAGVSNRQAVLKASPINANAMHVVLALLPKTFKCCANPDVYIVDVAIEKWFGYVKKTTFMNEEDPGYSRLWSHFDNRTDSLAVAIADTNTLSATTRSFGQFIEQTNWLHSNYGPDRDRKHRLDRLLQCVASLYKYCCNWANTRNVYQRHGREGAVPLTDEAAEAFRLLYEQCKRMQDLVLRYVLSEQFAREVAKQPKETANQQHCVLIDVFRRFEAILLQTGKFDVRGSADLWKCIVKLCNNNADTRMRSHTDQIQSLLKLLRDTIMRMDYDDADDADRNFKVALFHAKIMLRLYQLFGKHMDRCSTFNEYANLLLFLKGKFASAENEQAQALVGVVQDIFPIIYGKFYSFSITADHMLQLDLYMNMLSLLLNETDAETVENYAQCAFLLSQFAKILQKIATTDNTPPASAIDHYRSVVVRIATLTVLTAHRFPQLIGFFDRQLYDSLHHKTYFEALLAFDVWQLRCRFMTADQLQHYLLTMWCPGTGDSVFCYRTGFVFVRTLLCSFYDALPLESQNTFIDALAASNDEQARERSVQTSEPATKWLKVWRILGVERIADPLKRQQVADSCVDTYVLAAQQLVDSPRTSDDYRRRFYARERARHGLRGIRTDQTIVVLGELCDRFCGELPVCFSVELDHLLGHADWLTEAQVLHVLRALAAHFAKRAAERERDQHPDTLIRLQTIDWLCHAAARPLSLTTDTGSECVRRVAELFGQLLHAPSDGGGGDGSVTIAYDAFMQANCMRRFVDVGPLMRQEAIIGRTLQHSAPLKLDVARVLRKERLPTGAEPIADAKLLEMLGQTQYRHVCKGHFNDLTGRKIEASIGDLEEMMLMLDRVHANGLLTTEHCSMLRNIKQKLSSFSDY